jgi:hypothetical protein
MVRSGSSRSSRKHKILVDIQYVPGGEIMASLPSIQNDPMPTDFDLKVKFLASVTSERIDDRKHGFLTGEALEEARKIINVHEGEIHNIGSPLANEYGSITIVPDDFHNI